MSGRVIGFIVLTAILGHRAGRARGRRDVRRGHRERRCWLALAGMVVFIAYAIVRGVINKVTR